MRQNRLIPALLALVCASALGIWYLLDLSGTNVHAPAVTDTASTNLGESTPLNADPNAGQPGGNDTLRVPKGGFKRPDPEPTGQPDPNNSQPTDVNELEDDEWLIRGTVKFAYGLPITPGQMFSGFGTNVDIYFRTEDPEPELYDFYADTNLDGYFEEVVDEDSLPFRNKRLPPGRWQVVVDATGEVLTLEDIDEETGLDQLGGLCTPKISGHLIDFGTITLDFKAVFGDMWLLTGRIKHSSGRVLSLCSSPVLMIKTADDDEFEEWAGTDQDGQFLVTVYPEDLPPDPANWNVTLCASEDDYYWLTEGRKVTSCVRLGQRAVRGRIVDFGDITVIGALLEIEARMPGVEPELTSDGKLATSPWSEGRGKTASIFLDDGYTSYSTTVYPSPFKSLLWLAEGRYSFDARVSSYDFWSACEGVANAFDGKVTSITLEFVRYEPIPVEFLTDEGRDVPWVNLRWSIESGDETLASGDYDGSPPVKIPVAPGAETHCTVNARGFEETTAVAHENDEKLVVRLTTAEASSATLAVTIPKFPEGVSFITCAPFIVVADAETGASTSTRVTSLDETLISVAAGSYKVHLSGGARYGYPGGLMSGPVEVAVAVGETTAVALPEIAPPPWDTAARALVSNVTCGGRNVTLNTLVYIDEGEATTFVSMTTGQDISIGAPPLAVPDGNRRIALEVSPPAKDGEGALVGLDLDPRIEVRLTRNGKEITSFIANASSRSGITNKETNMQASVQTGVAELWVPPGSAYVFVQVEGKTVGKTIEVERGRTTRVDFAIQSVRVDFQMGETGSDDYDAYSELPPPWRVYRLTEEGQEVFYDLWESQAILFDPGQYVVVAGYGKPPQTLDLDLSDGNDRTINLPDLPKLQLTTVRLKFDVSKFGDSWNEADIEYAPADRLMRPQQNTYWYWMSSRAMPDGLELMDVPLDTDLVLGGWAYHGTSGETWILKPLRVRVHEENESIDCTWVKGVPMGSEWWDYEFFCSSVFPGLYVPLGEFDELVPGRMEVVVLDDDGKIAVREWITVPETVGEDGFDLPDTLRAAMVTAGLIEPDDPE